MADLEDQPAIGFLALVEIDWAAGAVGNMGYRLHPDWCGKGLGTRFMRRVTEWCFARGFKTLRLDVSAANARAIRCYVKTGFVETGEFWRASPDLIGEDLEDPRYDFVRPHVRWDESMPQVRFWWMERRV
jgi:RimJ/RimL family protein N-acetyltransferase